MAGLRKVVVKLDKLDSCSATLRYAPRFHRKKSPKKYIKKYIQKKNFEKKYFEKNSKKKF
jgi:hypothetical protein